jgi:outer membrane protein OmpA-like peptidoglycan-associated protein
MSARKNYVLIIGLISASFFMSGCVPATDNSARCKLNQDVQESVEPEKFVGIVLAPTSNFVDFSSALNSALPQIDQNLDRNSVVQVSVSVADGSPGIERTKVLNFPDALTGVDRDELVKDLQSDLDLISKCFTGEFDSSISVDAETDQLAAIQALSNGMSNATGDKSIFIIGNGINTVGQLNFIDNFPAEGAASKAGQFKSDGALPDLSGVNFFWYGLGQTDGITQARLEPQSLSSLVDFWKAIISAAGGVPTGVSAGSLVDERPSAFTIPVSEVAIASRASCINLTLTESGGFNFKPDSSTFLDVSSAQKGAGEIANKIIEKNCSTTITVTGYVASGTSKENFDKNPSAGQALSLARATAFKNLLIGAGVKQPITAVGGGKGPENDWDDSGEFIEAVGKLNRKVVVTQ